VTIGLCVARTVHDAVPDALNVQPFPINT
jgi:hypothetical protein